MLHSVAAPYCGVLADHHGAMKLRRKQCFIRLRPAGCAVTRLARLGKNEARLTAYEAALRAMKRTSGA